MKSYKTLVAACLALLSAHSALALEKEGGGGIIIAAEFATFGRRAIELLGFGDPSLNTKAILESIRDVKVVPVDELCKTEPVLGKRYCEDAHYDRANNIVLFNFNRWDALQCVEKLVLSSHEFLRAASVEGEDYSLSGRFISYQLVQCEGSTPEDSVRCSDRGRQISYEINHMCRRLAELQRNRG